MSDVWGQVDYEKITGPDRRTLTDVYDKLNDLYNKHLHPVVAEAYEVDVSTDDYVVIINKGNYKFTQVDVAVNTTTTIIVEYSYNSTNWWTWDSVSSTEYHDRFNLAAEYVKVTVKKASGAKASICVGAVP